MLHDLPWCRINKVMINLLAGWLLGSAILRTTGMTEVDLFHPPDSDLFAGWVIYPLFEQPGPVPKTRLCWSDIRLKQLKLPESVRVPCHWTTKQTPFFLPNPPPHPMPRHFFSDLKHAVSRWSTGSLIITAIVKVVLQACGSFKWVYNWINDWYSTRTWRYDRTFIYACCTDEKIKIAVLARGAEKAIYGKRIPYGLSWWGNPCCGSKYTDKMFCLNDRFLKIIDNFFDIWLSFASLGLKTQ